MRDTNRGITLIEVLMCLAIMVILISMTAPDLSTHVQRTASETAITELARMIAKGRADAIHHGGLVSLCSLQPSGLAPKCRKGAWLNPVTLFIDHNGDSVLDGGDRILSQQRLPAVPGTLWFRSFPSGKTALQFNELGFTNNQTGNFLWCASSRDARTAHQLIFINTGRSRLAQDRDGDGVREAANGKNLSCP